MRTDPRSLGPIAVGFLFSALLLTIPLLI